MSMNAAEELRSDSATFRATVDFPDPEPPAMPMIKGFTAAAAGSSKAAQGVREWKALSLSQSRIS